MATTYTHAFVGLGLARLYATRPMPWLYWGLAAILPTVPDLDVFSPAAYGSPLGHRGITHSLVFALLLSVVAASAIVPQVSGALVVARRPVLRYSCLPRAPRCADLRR